MAVSATYLSNFYSSTPSNSTLSSMQPSLASFDYHGVVADMLSVCSINILEKATRLCDSITQNEIQTIAAGLKADFKTEQNSFLKSLLEGGVADKKPFRAVLENIDRFKWEIGGQVRGACKFAANIIDNRSFPAGLVSENYTEKAKVIYQKFTTALKDLPPEGETQIEAFVLKKGYKKAPKFQLKGTTPDARVFKPYQSSDRKALPPLFPPFTQQDSKYFKILGKNLKVCKEGDLKKLYEKRNDVTQRAKTVFNQFSANFSDYDPDLSEKYSRELKPLFKKFSKFDLEEVQLKGRCKHYYEKVPNYIYESIKDLLQVSKSKTKPYSNTEPEEVTGILSDFSVEKEYASVNNPPFNPHVFSENIKTLMTDLKYPLKNTFKAALTEKKALYFKGKKALQKQVADIDGDSLHETFKKRFIVCTSSGCPNTYNEKDYFFEKQHPFLSGMGKVAKALPEILEAVSDFWKIYEEYKEFSRNQQPLPSFKGCTDYTSKPVADADHVTRIAEIVGLSLDGLTPPKIDVLNLEANIKAGCSSDLSLAKDILQLTEDVTSKVDLKGQYRQIAKKVHPDHCQKDHIASICEAVFRAANEAMIALENRVA